MESQGSRASPKKSLKISGKASQPLYRGTGNLNRTWSRSRPSLRSLFDGQPHLKNGHLKGECPAILSTLTKQRKVSEVRKGERTGPKPLIKPGSRIRHERLLPSLFSNGFKRGKIDKSRLEDQGEKLVRCLDVSKSKATERIVHSSKTMLRGTFEGPGLEQSTILGLIEVQIRGTEEIDRLAMLLAQGEADLALLKADQTTAVSWEPGAMLALQNKNVLLREENCVLKETCGGPSTAAASDLDAATKKV
ncbi:hypothetical protein HAX54_019635 [Datura stramonium]|uniref:Uncharacterized protein n=1 Tax=Datura stramonium TaxID=4076 RepID=A0ABS8UPH3_DATST|nr:hypothetical protein [Datura stramonium]